MRVLVTGHNGYIGSVMVPILQAAGHTVTGFDTYFYGDCTFGRNTPEIPSLKKDVRNAQLEDLVGFDAIIHLAALSNDPLGNLDSDLTDEINNRASVRLAKLAKQAGVRRFLFSSSCSLYGVAGDAILTEEASFNPVTAYGWSKVHVETEITKLADETFSPTCLRNATAYGVSPRIRIDVVVNNLVGYAVTTGEIFIMSDGTPWRPLVHVEDISQAFLYVLEAPAELVHNQALNVGSTRENYQVRELAEMIRHVVPGSRITYAEGAGPDSRCYRVDCNYIGRRLHGFKPQWTARRGIEQLYDAYCKTGLTVEDFEGERFKRIAHVKKLIREGEFDEDLRRVSRPTQASAA